MLVDVAHTGAELDCRSISISRCDYLALRDALLDYLSDLTRAGITPVVVVDGMQDSEKEATTLDRRRTQARRDPVEVPREGIYRADPNSHHSSQRSGSNP